MALALGCGSPYKTRSQPRCDPQPLPRCAPGSSIDVAHALGQQTGLQLTVRGRVEQAWLNCLLLGPDGRCSSGWGLVQEGVAGLLEVRGAAIGCQGPEHHMCCEIEALGKEAVATGTLQRDNRTDWIADATLCAP